MQTTRNTPQKATRTIWRRPLRFSVALIILLLPAAFAPAADWDNPGTGDWLDAGNWNPPAVPTAADEVNIDNGGTAQVQDPGAEAANLFIGRTNSNSGALEITDGGTLGNTQGLIGDESGSTGTVLVDGVGSTWTNSSSLTVGRSGTGTLTIQNGGTVSNTSGIIGEFFAGSGSVTVDGAGSTWTNSGSLIVGANRPGSLNISSGGTVSNTNAIIGDGVFGSGTVTVDGTGSTWTSNGNLTVGNAGPGTLTIRNDGIANVTGSLTLGVSGGGFVSGPATGTLNIGDGGAAGLLNATTITSGSGNAILNFNHTDIDHFFTHDGTAGGTAVDITGSTRVNHLGTGITVLTGNNTYTGATIINAGTLRANATGVFGNNSATSVAAGATLDLNGFDQTLGSLAGAGDVTLGAATLAIGSNNTSTTFSGALSGTGALTKLGDGMLTLSGANTYTGGTNINAGMLDIVNNASLGDAAGPLSFDGGTLRVTTGFTMNRDTTLNSGGGTFLVFPGTTLTQQGLISGDGSLTKIGAGILELTNNNTYTGGTQINGGILSIASDANLGAASGSLSLNSGTLQSTASFTLDRTTTLGGGTFDVTTGTLTHQGDISGGGSLAKAGAGTLTLTGANTYSGGTTVRQGTLQVDGGSINHTGTNFFVGNQSGDNGTLEILNGGTVSNNAGRIGNLAGSTGTVTVDGAGSTWTNSGSLLVGHSGAGTLTITNGGTVSSGFGAVANFPGGAGTATVDGAGSTWTVNGDLWIGRDGPGTLTLQNGGTVNVTGGIALSLGNPAGILNIGAGGAAGILNTSVVSSGIGGDPILNFNHTDIEHFFTSDGTAGGAAIDITGRVRLNHLGTGTTILTGNNNHTRGTNISAGTLQIGSGGTSGSITGNVANNGTLIFNRSDASSFDGAISGTGTLQQIGTGTTTFTGANTYTGGTTISTGALQIGSGGTSGSITGNVANNGTLIFNRSDALSFGGIISGTGDLQQIGAGTTTLTGANTYTGPTTIDNGILQVDGSIASDTTVNAGGTLSGSGTIAGAVVVDGTLSAGSSPGTLTVDSLTLNSGSTSVFELNTPGVVGGDDPVTGNDLVVVNNDLTLGGTLAAQVAAAGYYRLFNYGGTLTGSFDDETVSGNGGFDPESHQVLTNIDGQVNFSALGSDQLMQFWDGADMTGNGSVDGGAGTWNAANTNWTGMPGAAEINDQWRGSVGVFAGAAGGAVTVEGTQSFDTLQFSVNDYALNGDTLAIAPAAGPAGTFNIDGGVSATIGSVIADGGGSALAKVGGGTLVLSGNNTFSGGTTLSGGTLRLEHDNALGTGILDILGSTVDYADGVTIANAIDLHNDATLNVDTGSAEQAGDIGESGGAFAITKTGAGTLALSGANAYTGGTTVEAGTLRAGAAGAFVGDTAYTVNGGTLDLNDFNLSMSSLVGTGGSVALGAANLTIDQAGDTTFAGGINGTGIFTKSGDGMLTLTGSNTYTGSIGLGRGTIVKQGALRVDGGSISHPSAGTIVGDAAGDDGTLRIENGGTLIDNRSTLANAINSIGTVTVDGAGSSWSSGGQNVGMRGTATLTVSNGGTVSSSGSTNIAWGTGSAGTVTVDGAGSAWTHAGQLSVGRIGSATLTISDGGAVSNGNGIIGAVADSTGTVTVDGAGSSWSNSTLTVGSSGSGTLTIANGGTVNVPFGITLASAADSSGTLNIGSGSASGILNTPSVHGGSGSATLNFNHINVGPYFFTSDGTAGGDAIAITGSTTVNHLGLSATVLTGANTYTGATNVDTGALRAGAVNVFGDNSAVTVASGASLALNDFDQTIGSLAGAGGVTLGTATLTTGGDDTDTAFSGVISGAGVLAKTGSGAFSLSGNNTYSGGTTLAGGTLRLEHDNALGTGSLTILGSTVDYAGSVAIANFIELQSDATLNVSTGSATQSGAISESAGSFGISKTGAGTLSLTGTNTYSGGTTINLGTLQVDGGSISHAGANTVIGNLAGDDATLAVLNGGTVSNDIGRIGGLADSTGTVTVDGTGSSWTNSGVLAVGSSGAGTLNITGGGAVSNVGQGLVGRLTGSTGTVTVDGADSNWSNSTSLIVGDFGAGTLDITDGGTVNNTVGVIARFAGGTGTVTVDGAGSNWSNSSVLVVGSSDVGTLAITNGGVVSSTDGFIGSNADGVGMVAVDGAGSTWTNSGLLMVGSAGSGTLTVTDGGLVNAAGAFTLADNADSIGTLDIGDGGAAGILNTASVNGGDGTATLNFNHNAGSYFFTSDGTAGGTGIAVTGSTTVNQIGTGATVLIGNNTYNGATNVDSGLLRAGAANVFGSNSAVTVASGATLALNDFDQAVGSLAGAGNVTLGAATLTAGGNDTGTAFSGILSGTGALTKAGMETLTLSGTNTYAGGTNINAGTLSVAANANLGDAAGALAFDGGTLQTTAGISMNRATTLNAGNGTFDVTTDLLSHQGTIGGDGSLIKTGAGILDLSGANTYTGGTTLNGGTLRVASDAALGSGTLTILGSTLDYADTVALANAIELQNDATLNVDAGAAEQAGDIGETGGAFAITKTGDGTLALSGSNSHTGGTTIDAGTLQLGDGGSSGSLTGDVTNNAALALNRADAVTIGGVISGTGVLQQIGTGTTTFTGANTYTGGTTISGGALQIGSGGTSGSITGNVANNGSLIFNRSDALSFGGVISGTGNLQQIGAGTTTLTGANTYTGATTIDNGLLQVNGSIAGSTTTINTGGALGGTGTVGSVIVNGGTVAPGNSIGTLAVNGDIDFSGGGLYRVEADAEGNADRIAATGQATLTGGSVQVVPLPGDYADSTDYTILTAEGGLNGEFDAVSSTLAFLDPTLSQNANNVFLNLTRNDLGFDDTTVAATRNQRAVARLLQQLAGNPTLADIFDNLLILTAEGAQRAFESLSGVQHSHPQQLTQLLGRQFQSLLFGRLSGSSLFLAGSSGPASTFHSQHWQELLPEYQALSGALGGGASADADAERERGLWLRAFGGFGEIDDTRNATGADYTYGGVALGADTELREDVTLGAAFSYTRSSADTAGGDLDVNSFQIAAYGGGKREDYYLNGTAGFGHHRIDSSRRVTVGSSSSRAKADYDAYHISLAAEGGRAFPLTEQTAATPFLGLEYTHLNRDGFTEKGAGAANLKLRKETQDSLRSALGVRFSHDLRTGAGRLITPSIEAAWVHEYLDRDSRLTAGFAAAPGATFRIAGPELDRNRARIGAGVSARLNDTTSLNLGYQGDIAGSDDHHSFAATLRMAW